jgi:hypothetical protein
VTTISLDFRKVVLVVSQLRKAFTQPPAWFHSGSVVAVCTNATTKESESRLVISQPDAALYIQPPTLETRVAVRQQLVDS